MVNFFLQCVGRERATLLYRGVKERGGLGCNDKIGRHSQALGVREPTAPIAKIGDLYSVYFALAGGKGQHSCPYKCCRICVHAGYGNEFVNGHLCVHSQWHNHHHFSKKGGNIYCKKFIYTDVKIDKFKRQD